ncbi:MAG: serine hydrolase domain-containing protein [Janthinobacterium lividum]
MTIAVENPENVGMSSGRLKRIDAAMQAYVDRGTYSGINTLVARRGQIVHAGHYGWRDRETRAPMAADTIVRLYSMTKPIVCTALMTLFEEGSFTLVDPVAKFIPAFADVKVLSEDGSRVDPIRPMTIGDVMAHTSGLTYHFLGEPPLSAMYDSAAILSADVSLADAIDDLARFPLAFHPGTRWKYSYGNDVVGRLVEVIAGQPLRQVLTERLFGPLAMPDTDYGVAEGKRDRLAAMYGRRDLISAGVTAPACHEPWARGVNVKHDVSASYPVDKSDTFQRGGHGLFGTIGDYFPLRPDALQRGNARRTARDRPQDAGADARQPHPRGTPAARNRRAAAHGLRLRPRLPRRARHRADGRAGVHRRVRLVRCCQDALLGRPQGGHRRAVHDAIDDELRLAGAAVAGARVSGVRVSPVIPGRALARARHPYAAASQELSRPWCADGDPPGSGFRALAVLSPE